MKAGFNIAQKLLSVSILMSFLFFSTPREALHELFAHHDTHEACETPSDNGYSLEKIHTHCDFFKIKSGPVYISKQITFVVSLPVFSRIQNENTEFHIQSFSSFSSDRAPPLC